MNRLSMHVSRAILAAGLVAGAGLAVSAPGQVVIDFGGLPGMHNLLTAGPYSEDGFTLTSTAAGQLAVVNGFQPNGLALRGTTAAPQVVRLSNGTGDLFDLLSIAIGDNSLANAVMFSGSTGANRLVIDSDLGGWIAFSNEWRNLAWVDITVMSAPSGAPGQLTADNIAVLPVPGPSTALVLGVGACVGARRRRT